MKTAKLTNVTNGEAASIILILGGQTVAYRDAPLLHITHVIDVCNEMEANNVDTIFFDKGAIFDAPAYDLARQAVDGFNDKHPGKLQVVIYNKP